jgi:hypothetical protein
MNLVEIKLTEKQSDLLECIIDRCYDVEDYMNPFLEADKSIAKEDGQWCYQTNWYHNGWGKWDLCKGSLGDIIKIAQTYNVNKKQILVFNNLIKKLETANKELV